MTLDDVARRVEQVRRVATEARDYELAQVLERSLHDEVVAAMKCGQADVECAKLALTTLNVDFPRWEASA